MILDCFPFFNEIRLLLVRLHYLEDVVDRFVVSEGTTTFTGHPKPLFLDQFWEAIPPRLAKKIVRVQADMSNMSGNVSPWAREAYQRAISVDAGVRMSRNYQDILHVSDVDEIPHKDLLIYAKRMGVGSVLKLLQHGLKYTPDIYSGPWSMAFMGPVGKIDARNVETLRRDTGLPHIDNAGWHFSYCSTPEKIMHKIHAYSHQEFNKPEWNNLDNIKKSIENRTDLFGRFPGEVNEIWPRERYPDDLKNLLNLYYPVE